MAEPHPPRDGDLLQAYGSLDGLEVPGLERHRDELRAREQELLRREHGGGLSSQQQHQLARVRERLDAVLRELHRREVASARRAAEHQVAALEHQHRHDIHEDAVTVHHDHVVQGDHVHREPGDKQHHLPRHDGAEQDRARHEAEHLARVERHLEEDP